MTSFSFNPDIYKKDVRALGNAFQEIIAEIEKLRKL